MTTNVQPRLLSEIESPRPMRAQQGAIQLRGWCLFSGNPAAPTVRVQVGDASHDLESGLARPDLADSLPGEPAAKVSGFQGSPPLPVGIHCLRFEAQAESGEWTLFKRLTLAVEPTPLQAVIDSPIRQGTLRDRVKVGGWCPSAVKALNLHYGHRKTPCRLGLKRPESTSDTTGFETEAPLVAGRGEVRIRTIFDNGDARIIRTPLRFAIDTDENHPAALKLDAALSELPRPEIRPFDPPHRSLHPHRILFVLPGSFAANHALHVAALANHLILAGHSCCVTVARDPDTASHLYQPLFEYADHGETEARLREGSWAPFDFIHAWTTAESTRIATAKFHSFGQPKLVIHLEDNEPLIFAKTAQKTEAEIAAMPEAEIDALSRPDLAHPRRRTPFLAGADGLTTIVDSLHALAPENLPLHTINPGADERFFHPRPYPAGFRQALGIAEPHTLLCYPGNVHATNRDEVAELYAAVIRLNRSGHRCHLIRTGLDRAPLPQPLLRDIAPYLISLGQIHHHHHLPAIMSLADIFVQPGVPDAFNRYRFPSKLPEFFALGRPVILPRVNLGEGLRHKAEAWVLDEARAESIAEAVLAIRSQPSLEQTLQKGAAALAQSRFNWATSADGLANFYDGMASSVAS